MENNNHFTVKFCHIVPTPHLAELTVTNGSHLILAHLADPQFSNGRFYNEQYVNFYATRAERGDTRYTICDNSAFEMIKHNDGVMYPADRLLEIASTMNPDCIVLSDYPAECWTLTRDAAIEQIPQFKEAGFDTFYVPQSEIGDMEGYLKSIEWALDNPDVDIIGISILGVPNAFGDIEKDNKLQRCLARYRMMHILEERGLLTEKAIDRFHFLGALDSMYELQMCQRFFKFIRSSDSSVAAWRGLNYQNFDSSPTGMMNGKFEKEVNFNEEFSSDAVANALTQIQLWDRTL